MKITSLEEARAAAFRGAYRGLRSQGWQRSVVEFEYAYRGYYGMCCPVGWLLRSVPENANSDNVHQLRSRLGDKKFGELFAKPLAKWWRSASAHERDGFVDFLSVLQTIHDNTFPFQQSSGRSLKEQFEKLRINNRWPVPSVLPGENPKPEKEAK